jgi:hypothetical protein
MYTFRDLLESGKTYSMDEQKIKEAMASSGKTKITDLIILLKTDPSSSTGSAMNFLYSHQSLYWFMVIFVFLSGMQ